VAHPHDAGLVTFAFIRPTRGAVLPFSFARGRNRHFGEFVISTESPSPAGRGRTLGAFDVGVPLSSNQERTRVKWLKMRPLAHFSLLSKGNRSPRSAVP